MDYIFYLLIIKKTIFYNCFSGFFELYPFFDYFLVILLYFCTDELLFSQTNDFKRQKNVILLIYYMQ